MCVVLSTQYDLELLKRYSHVVYCRMHRQLRPHYINHHLSPIFNSPSYFYALSFAMSGRIEKHILRAAFDTPEDPYLPKEILWRQKEQVRLCLCLTPAQQCLSNIVYPFSLPSSHSISIVLRRSRLRLD
jgi:asparagine synthetase B (glutamine-hydrolysing)